MGWPVRIRDAGGALLALALLNTYALWRAMTPHRSSIARAAEFTPPPPITLERAQVDAEPKLAMSGLQKSRARRRLAALLAILAVPAMAAPGDFGAMPGDAASDGVSFDAGEPPTQPMGFDQRGMSFPGSAFFYLADPPEAALIALPASDPLEAGALGSRAVGAVIDPGPAAASFTAAEGVHLNRSTQCLAQAIWYEAASEGEAGQRAVAQVVLNRVAHPAWPSSVCGVVYEGSQRSTGCQFSFTCDGSMARRVPETSVGRTRQSKWSKARAIAREALEGSVYAPIGHATHYHTLWVDPYWAKTLDPVGVIGAHRFYRLRGEQGQARAFSATYAGVEPAAPLANTQIAPEPDTVARLAPPQRIEPDLAFDPSPTEAPSNDEKAPFAVAPPKARTGQTRQEYARAGQWKVDPITLNLAEAGRDETPEQPRETSPGNP